MNKVDAKTEYANSVTDRLLDASEKLYKIHEPGWNARADVLRTIVSLTSGSIVLSVTFSKSIHDLNLRLRWHYLVAFSFTLLLVSLITALAALWIGVRVYGMQTDTFNTRMTVSKAFVDATTHEEFMAAFDRIQTPVNKRIAISDKWVERLFHLSSGAFGFAVVMLAIVGIKQLLN